MDREAVTRRDFSTGRRGYDVAAVGEHLRRVADELDALRAAGGPGARRPALVALNPALEGAPSEQTAACLAEHFALTDAGGPLDDVYARAGG